MHCVLKLRSTLCHRKKGKKICVLGIATGVRAHKVSLGRWTLGNAPSKDRKAQLRINLHQVIIVAIITIMKVIVTIICNEAHSKGGGKGFGVGYLESSDAIVIKLAWYR